MTDQNQACHDLALYELGALQEVIARHEQHAFTVMSYLSLVLSGMAILVFTGGNTTSLKFGSVLGMGSAAVVLFTAWAVSHRVLCSSAIDRVKEVEEMLNGAPGTYKGPDLCNAVDWIRTPRKPRWQLWRDAFWYPTNIVPFGLALGIVVTIAWYAPDSSSAPPAVARASVK